MKNLILILLFLVATYSCFAQDIIRLKSGDEIKAKVIEITSNQIKYRDFINPDGPIKSIYITKVSVITYENGTREVFDSKLIKSAPQHVPEQPVEFGQAPVKLGGPRIGVTYITPGKFANKLEDNYDANPILTQFGWQFETRFFTLPDGFSGVFELVPLIGGLEQGLFLPSISGLIGVRTANGIEFGVGPNVSLAGAAIVFAAGITLRSEYINFPINVAYVPSKDGGRMGFLFGFNYRSK